MSIRSWLYKLRKSLGRYDQQTNLTSLLDALGIPDVSGKSLYTVLVTDRLDNAENGNAAILAALNNGNTVWYADSSVSASGAGTAWSNAFKTIAEAIAAASAGDVIRIKGEFNESNLDLAVELTLIGENTSDNQYNTLIYSTDATPLVFVEANNCKIFNIGFAQQAADNAITIGDDAGESWYKLHIRGCKFDGFGTGLLGVASGSGADAPDITIEDCLFRSFATGFIGSNWTRGEIKNNRFIVNGATYAITHTPDAGSRPDTIIEGNIFTGNNASSAGIVVSNTPTTGMLAITGNKFVNFLTPDLCVSKRVGYCNGNDYGSFISYGTLSYLDAGSTQDIVEITTNDKIKVHGIVIDCNALTQNGTLGFQTKVDGSNYREVNKAAFTVASDDSVSLEINQVLNTDFKFTWLEGGDEGAARDIPYRLSYTPVE